MENPENEEHFQRQQIIAHKEILSFKEAINYLDVSKSFLYKLTSKRKLTFTKPNGGKIYFKKVDLDNWMLQNNKNSLNALEENVMNHLKENAK